MDVRLGPLVAEPSGWDAARVQLLAALAFLGMYAFFELVDDGGLVSVLVIGVASALSGVAELLPADRRLAAGAVRVTAIAVLMALIGRSLVGLLA